VTRSRYVARLVEPACLVASGSEVDVQETRRVGEMAVGRKLSFGVELVESVLEGWREEGRGDNYGGAAAKGGIASSGCYSGTIPHSKTK
jgi:hypothetical protein